MAQPTLSELYGLLDALQDSLHETILERNYFMSESKSWELDLDTPEEVESRLEDFCQMIQKLQDDIQSVRDDIRKLEEQQ